MAIPTSYFWQHASGPINPEAHTRTVAVVARCLGVDPRTIQKMSVNRNFADGAAQVMFEFAPTRASTDMSEAVESISQKLDDSFRGPIIRAAVPDLCKDLDHLVEIFKKTTSQPYRVIYDADRLQELLESS